ncbi:ATP-dependent zinc metalloprotease FtsH [Pseudocercospora fuligena]|uniref:ATP-dependent zinc metalloprotease FtsH n=1 Tax=Pseudocercospora fuligena TaxID=685502 RepID=A0A8H6VRT7_9PEZI|nr:ATP-dependent zinc metalloprotease FtsH [Pseudocercospora fuligena]
MAETADAVMSAEITGAPDSVGHVSDESWEQPVAHKEDHAKGPEEARGRSRHSRSRESSRASSRRSSSLSEVSDEDGPIGESAEIIEVFRARWEDWTTDKPKKKSRLHIPRNRAIVVRHHEPENEPWQLHSITIRSPYIRKVLAAAFQDYPGIDAKLEDMTFRAPFQELFFRWNKFLDLLRDEADETVIEHCNLLIDTMKETLQPKLERAADLKSRDLIEYEYLWTLFEPGTEVYSNVDDHHRLYIVDDSYPVDAEYEKKEFVVHCRYVDFDGSKLGFDTAKRKIPVFKGVKPITELPIFPSAAHTDIVDIRRQLDQQGQKMLAHCGVHFVQYTGFALEYDDFNQDQNQKPKWIDHQRIVIDARSWMQQNVSMAPVLDPISSAVRQRSRSDSISPSRGYAKLPPPMDPFPFQNGAKLEMPSQKEPDLSIPDHLVKYCAPFVRGFNLKTKKWVACFVDGVENIDWNDRAFEKLLLRQQYKDMILAFMQSHIQSKDQFDDIIKGKGQGFVMLLEGEAGVGKTLTAESIAEQMHQPLYSLSAGELGTTTESVDHALQRVLDLCAKWHAVLLIDECDVYLEQRSVSDLERNKLVAVFLRLLEYYAGIMLLTTNRASSIDAAFQSRIHLSITYPREPSEKHYTDDPISEDQLNTLSKLDFNGREIKSIARSARLLAARDEKPLSFEHVQAVLDVKKGGVKGAPKVESWRAAVAAFLIGLVIVWWLYGRFAGRPAGTTCTVSYKASTPTLTE